MTWTLDPVTEEIEVESIRMNWLACIIEMSSVVRGWNCVVGMASSYGFEDPGTNPGGDEVLTHFHTGPGSHAAYCKMSTRHFSGG
jgi:hypothetical protein